MINIGCNEKKITIHRVGINFKKFKFSERETRAKKHVKILTIPIFLFRTLPTKLKIRRIGSQKRMKDKHKTRSGITEDFLRKIWHTKIKCICQKNI